MRTDLTELAATVVAISQALEATGRSHQAVLERVVLASEVTDNMREALDRAAGKGASSGR